MIALSFVALTIGCSRGVNEHDIPGNFAVRIGDERQVLKSQPGDAIPFLATFAEKADFIRQRSRYRKSTSCGIVFETGIDLGGRRGNPDCGVKLPIYLSVFHKDEPRFVFNLALFERIIPGFDRYFYSETASSHVLGMRAHVELFDVLTKSFG